MAHPTIPAAEEGVLTPSGTIPAVSAPFSTACCLHQISGRSEGRTSIVFVDEQWSHSKFKVKQLHWFSACRWISPETARWLEQSRSASLVSLSFSCYPEHRAHPPGRLSHRKWGLYKQWQIVMLLSRIAQVGREQTHPFLHSFPHWSLWFLHPTTATLFNSGGRGLSKRQLCHCVGPTQREAAPEPGRAAAGEQDVILPVLNRGCGWTAALNLYRENLAFPDCRRLGLASLIAHLDITTHPLSHTHPQISVHTPHTVRTFSKLYFMLIFFFAWNVSLLPAAAKSGGQMFSHGKISRPSTVPSDVSVGVNPSFDLNRQYIYPLAFCGVSGGGGRLFIFKRRELLNLLYLDAAQLFVIITNTWCHWNLFLCHYPHPR